MAGWNQIHYKALHHSALPAKGFMFTLQLAQHPAMELPNQEVYVCVYEQE